MYKKRLVMNLMIKLLYFDINYLPAFKVWRDMDMKSRSYRDFIKMEVSKAES
jgi:hypothetical protein